LLCYLLYLAFWAEGRSDVMLVTSCKKTVRRQEKRKVRGDTSRRAHVVGWKMKKQLEQIKNFTAQWALGYCRIIPPLGRLGDDDVSHVWATQQSICWKQKRLLCLWNLARSSVSAGAVAKLFCWLFTFQQRIAQARDRRRRKLRFFFRLCISAFFLSFSSEMRVAGWGKVSANQPRNEREFTMSKNNLCRRSPDLYTFSQSCTHCIVCTAKERNCLAQ
jgi:hypothetical protein